METIKIRLACLEDREGLVELFTKSIKGAILSDGLPEEEVGDFVKEEVEYKNTILDQTFLDKSIDRVFLIAVDDGKVVGCICHGPCSDIIDDHGGRNTEGLNEIGSAYVLPDYQSKGIMRLLFNGILLTLKSKGIEEFCLDSGYATAKQIWAKKLGKPNKILKDFWEKDVDHHIWYRKTDDVPCEYQL